MPGGHGEAGNDVPRTVARPALSAPTSSRLVDADEVGDEGVGRLAIDLDRRRRLADLALAHHHDEVGHGHGLALVMGDDDGGDAEPLLQLAQFDLHRLAQLGVERRQRLVEQEQLRRQRQRAGNRHALALAARKLGHRPVGEAGQMDQRRAARRRASSARPWARRGCAADRRCCRRRTDAETAPATGTPCRDCACASAPA